MTNETLDAMIAFGPLFAFILAVLWAERVRAPFVYILAVAAGVLSMLVLPDTSLRVVTLLAVGAVLIRLVTVQSEPDSSDL